MSAASSLLRLPAFAGEDGGATSGLGRALQATTHFDESCKVGAAMAIAYGLLGAVWVLLLIMWAVNVRKHKKRTQILYLLFVVPLIQIGDAAVTMYSYSVCHCLVCHFNSVAEYRAWVVALYAFSVGRLSAMPLCLFVLATGTGTLYRKMPAHKWCAIVVLFGTFFVSNALMASPSSGVDGWFALWLSLFLYLLIWVAIYAEAAVNSKVLKAQLLMIREQGINPKTCPAYAKHKLFRALRRSTAFYLILHCVLTIVQFHDMQWAWQEFFFNLIWESLQLAVAIFIGYKLREKGGTNIYVTLEEHLPPTAVRSPLLATDVDLTDAELADGGDPWQETLQVPPPPERPAIGEVLFGWLSESGGDASTSTRETAEVKAEAEVELGDKPAPASAEKRESELKRWSEE